MKPLKLDLTKILILLGLLFLLLLQLTGCDAGGGITIPNGASELTVSVKSDHSVLDDPVSVIITEAKVLIMNVEFEKQSDGRDQLHQRGPFVLVLNTSGAIHEMGTQYIIRDKYTKFKFQFHKPEESENPPDPDFKEGTAENLRYSFIIKGKYNGSNFVYKSKQAAAIVINFAQPENINLKKCNVTLLFNELKWFRNGSTELNPNDPQNAAMIDNNLKNSFSRIIRDDNKDGQPDN